MFHDQEYARDGRRYAIPMLLLGGVLLAGGLTVQSSWAAEALGLSRHVNDAAPGATLVLTGAFILYFTSVRVQQALHAEQGPDAGF